jgi:hypothetical protein
VVWWFGGLCLDWPSHVADELKRVCTYLGYQTSLECD